MANNGNNGVLLVATMQDKDEIIKTGGVTMPTPKVNWKRVNETTKYIVCCDQVTGSAFVVGEIDKVIYLNNKCIIKINRYASLDKPNTWQECGNKYGFTYLDNPSQMHLYVGRLKFKQISNGTYTDNYIENVKTIAATAVAVNEVKRSEPVKLSRIEELRKELAELEANRRAALHEMIDALADSQLDQVMEWLTMFVK